MANTYELRMSMSDGTKRTAQFTVPTPTAEEVGARPSDWMPSADDVGARPDTWTPTAAQVGAVPTSRTVNGKALSNNITLSASDVGARDDEWLPTPAEIGAQKLIGIGTFTGDLNDYETLMNTTAWVNGSSVANSPTTTTAVVETWGTGGSIVNQRVTTVNGYVITRMRYSGAWTEWEWDIPPMTNGKEYRTTKRVNGKVVYTQRISFGDLLNAQPKRMKITGFTSAYSIVDSRFIMKHKTSGHSMQLAYGSEPSFFVEQASSSVINLVVNTTSDFSAYSGYATIEYTKS